MDRSIFDPDSLYAGSENMSAYYCPHCNTWHYQDKCPNCDTGPRCPRCGQPMKCNQCESQELAVE